MSVETVVSGRCGCGNEIAAGAEEHGRASEDGEFWACGGCGDVVGSPLHGRRDCSRCGRALASWDERSCPLCGRVLNLSWGLAYN